MNRKKEYENLIRTELTLLGCSKQLTNEQLRKRDRRDGAITTKIEDYELSLLSEFFYSVIHRLVKLIPRKVIKYVGFDYKGNEFGINNLLKKVESGDSLTSHLSMDVFDSDQSRNNDPMLMNGLSIISISQSVKVMVHL